MHRQALPERALLSDPDAVVAQPAVFHEVVAPLGHQKLDVLQEVRVPLHEDLRAGPAQLFVRVPDEHDVAVEGRAAALEREQCHQLHDPFAAHVQRAAAPHVAVLDRS